MKIKVVSHLKRNRFGMLYFRRVIPPDVRCFFAFKEISRSTGTSKQGEAGALARRLCVTLDLLFERLREVAKNKKPEDLRAGLIVMIDFEKDGTLKSLFTDLEPGEEDAAARLVPQLLQVAQTGQLGKVVAPVAVSVKGPSLFAAVAQYLDENTKGGGWSAQTAQDVRGDFEQFKAILGDVPVAGIGHDALNGLKDTLLRLPANMNKLPLTRDKSIEAILALGLPPQAANTVKKKWTRLISFFDWVVGQGHMDRNLARGKKPKAKAQSYEKFTRDDLTLLFESEAYRTGSFDEAFQYWLPVLGLHTGARLEELAQLHLADIRKDASAEIWTIRITEEVDDEDGAESGKNLKNDSSDRICPIHTALETAGFLTYVDALKAEGCDRLFPELSLNASGKVGPRASEWFTEYRRGVLVGAVVGRSRKAFHSFRHTMNSALQGAGVPQEVRERLCGHTSQAVNLRVYGGGLAVRQLADAIGMLNYGIEIPAYVPSEKHKRARQKAGRRGAIAK